jgi:hypothetical protein
LVKHELDVSLLWRVVPDLDEALACCAIGTDCYLWRGITDSKKGLDHACTSFNVGSDWCVVEVKILVVLAVHRQDDCECAQVLGILVE